MAAHPQWLQLSLNLRAHLLLFASPWMNLEDHPKKIIQNLWLSPGMAFGPTDLGPDYTFSLGIYLGLSYWITWESRIYIPTNGANLRFSGSMGDYTELKC